MKVAVIFHRLGPYHVARLAAAGAQVDLTAVELASETREYAWDAVEAATSFRRVTLFPASDSRAASGAEVRQRLHSALDAAQPAVVVVPGWSDAGALAALQWCGRHSVPAVVMSESTAWDEPRASWKEWIKRQLIALCSAALAGGTPHADYLVQLGLPRKNIFLGYDAIDNNYFAQKTAEVRAHPSDVRKKHALPEHYFLASARFVAKKNLPKLLEAYARYRQLASTTESGNQPAAPWHLVLLGDGPLRPEIERLISDLRLQSSVSLPGFKQYPDLPAYYGCASAFIHASTTEQWGLVVNEAMASSLPVLVSNRCGCATDLVQNGVNGFTFDPHDVEAIAQLLLKVSAMDSSSPPRPGTSDARVAEEGIRSSEGRGGQASGRERVTGIQGEVSNLLSTFGAASHHIIANWSPDRFATGLKAAAEKAMEVGPMKPTLLQRAILKALLAR